MHPELRLVWSNRVEIVWKLDEGVTGDGPEVVRLLVGEEVSAEAGGGVLLLFAVEITTRTL